MTKARLRTVLVGMGKVGAGYADDPVMARSYRYATHAQVLAVHPGFAWEAVVDLSDEARETARGRWNIPYVAANLGELVRRYEPEVAVVATPPECRVEIIKHLPALRAILMEKPVASTIREAEELLGACNRRGIKVQVNLWRRADETFRAFAAGRLEELIGRPQAIFGLYGNGLLNNGTHMVDFVRMLFGEIEAVQAMSGVPPHSAGPIPGDMNLPFSLRLGSGLVAALQPIGFEHYRENSLDIWGSRARLCIVQEGLGIILYPLSDNRAMLSEREIASDRPRMLDSTVGDAFYHLYTNMAAAVHGEDSLWSSGKSALRTATVIQAVMDSARSNGGSIRVH